MASFCWNVCQHFVTVSFPNMGESSGKRRLFAVFSGTCGVLIINYKRKWKAGNQLMVYVSHNRNKVFFVDAPYYKMWLYICYNWQIFLVKETMQLYEITVLCCVLCDITLPDRGIFAWSAVWYAHEPEQLEKKSLRPSTCTPPIITEHTFTINWLVQVEHVWGWRGGDGWGWGGGRGRNGCR